MLKLNKIKPIGHQQGMATIVVSLVVLVMVTLVTFYTAKTVMVEQKLTANDYRSKQAFEAAETGMNEAIFFLNNTYTNDVTAFYNSDTGSTCETAITNTAAANDKYCVDLTNGSRAQVTLSGNLSITSTGFSDDDTGTRTIVQRAENVSPLPNVPANPLTAKGTVVVSGSASVYNHEGNSTIWSGKDVDLGSNNSTATYVADPTSTYYPLCMDTALTCDGIQSSNKTAIGLDVIEYDSTLGNLTPAQMFQNFFGMPPQVYREAVVDMDVAAADIANISNQVRKIIWVEGNASLGGITVGCSSNITGLNAAPGTMFPSQDCTDAELGPSIVIINGNLTVSGSPVINGVLFVMGNVSGNGNYSVRGAMIVAGDNDSSISGSIDVWYDSDNLSALGNFGKYTGSTGSWRDW